MSDSLALPSFLTDNSVAAAFKDAYTSFSERRAALGLPNPGTLDNISREVQKDVLLSNFMFTGLRADLTKVFGMSPLFRVSHAFSMGGSGNMPPYNFSAMYGSPKVFMQGNLGSDGGLAAVGNYRWTPKFVTKTNTQIMPGGQGLMQLDNDYTGDDFSASLKAFNPSCLEGGLTGIFVGSYLQSVTPNLALGFEAIWQRQAMNARPESALSYGARYKTADWIASAQLQAQGVITASYWKKLSERVEAGVDMNLQFAPNAAAALMGGPSRDGTTAIGAKYDFRASTFRAQVDSTGKVSCLLEKRIAMPIALTFAGEIDQAKQTAKLGLAVSLEIAGEELMEQQEKMSPEDMVPPPF
ncbi:mitochondrial import receptor subunit tom-40 [Aspergillus eucalypticola CBS 122712]|uniref:Translocase of outer membrane 40 kDa subunit n=1 Tax=Aspergillus eucalypticola (strain CBS 122712 / IBT 29274) TaxID=1448314 RepID=A0A317UP31_ASPEC|nr:mitochondrial import receptor subunit tom-40 [Aspergillus eucalypticola CBS 122712]PWY61840.1 mitochondrial import receptor subunit tom-40 [Aspergillus eucalypticola CBS 122712]